MGVLCRNVKYPFHHWSIFDNVCVPDVSRAYYDFRMWRFLEKFNLMYIVSLGILYQYSDKV